MSKPSPLADACAGAAGAVFANTLVFPLDVIKTRLQTQNKLVSGSEHYKNSVDAFLRILQKEGLQGLYSGLGAGLFGTVASSFSYFYFYSSIRAKYLASIPAGQTISTAVELLMGALAGALSQVFTLPIAVITTRQQTAPHDERESFFATLQTILRDEGAVGLWKGFKASMVLCSNPAITYGLFERVKGIWIRRKIAAGASPTLGSLEVFVVGALSKTLATVVTYPYIMAKVRMQWSPPKSLTNLTEIEQESFKYRDSIDVLKKVFATDGVAGWYKGMNTQIVKAVLCQAILFVSKEKFLEHTLTIFSLMGAAHHANITPVN